MQTSYRAARFSLALIDFLTWLALVAATIAAVRLYLIDQTLVALTVAGGAILFAMFEFTLTQLARAQIDTADNTADMLEILRQDRGHPVSRPNAPRGSINMENRREPAVKG